MTDTQLSTPIQSDAPEPTVPFIVGVGASAGGLEAMIEMVAAAPLEADVAYVVVQHLSPDYKSMIAELLSKKTELRVVRADQGAVVEAGIVYVIEPNTVLRMNKGTLEVEEAPKRHGIHLPIDIFFTSLAADQGSNCAAVILSGTGSDGSRGARAIKERGGFVIAQSTETSKFDGMPRSVIDTGIVDIVLAPGQMASYLAELVTSTPGQAAGGGEGFDDGVINRILGTIRQRTDLDFRHYKPSTLVRRIERRLQVLKLGDVDDYAERLERDPVEVATLHQELLIGVTQFFRDPESIVAARPYLRELVGKLDRPLRLWVAGCSTGEEAYTVAALAQEALDEAQCNFGFKLFATDVNPRSLQFAGIGHYAPGSVEDVPEDLLERYFEQTSSGNYRINKSLRDNMLFSLHNVFGDPPFSSLDMVVCRNVLIYLRPAVQQRVCRLFSFALRVGGILWLGPSEAAPDKEKNFELVSSRWKIYQLRERSNFHSILREYDSTVEDRRERTEVAALVRSSPNRPDLTEVVSAASAGFAPPFLVVDEELNLLFRSGGLQDILRVPEGRVTSNVRAMVPADLAFVVTTAVNKVDSSGDLIYRGLIHTGDLGRYRFDLRARAIHAPNRKTLVALYFEGLDTAPESPIELPLPTLSEDAKRRIVELESELQMSSENLQATVEELESSNEELQATNEELLASNEELQSLNEELQSVNEELHTLNAEHHGKIEELSVINADLDNLLAHVDIGTLFLSADLRVRRCNSRVGEFIHVRPLDSGRPLIHFGHELGDAPLVEDCARTVRTREPVERLLETVDGRRVLFRTTPLPAHSQEPGVVVTFTDVSTVHRAREAQSLLDDAFDRAGQPMALLDDKGQITYANAALSRLYERDPLWVVGMDARDLTDPRDHAAFDRGWQDILQGRPWSSLLVARRPNGERFIEHLTLFPMRPATGPSAILRTTGRLDPPGEAAGVLGHWIWDADRSEFQATTGLFDVLGIEPDADGRLPPERLMERVHMEDREVAEQFRLQVAEREPGEARFRVRSASGIWRVAYARWRPYETSDDSRRVGGASWIGP